MTGNDAQALTILTKINGKSKAQEILAEIKATVSEKTEKLFTYGWLVIFVGIMLSVFQQAVGINAVLYFAPRIFESLGMGNPMMQTVLMGAKVLIGVLLFLAAIAHTRDESSPPESKKPTFASAARRFSTPATSFLRICAHAVSRSSWQTASALAISQ